MKTVLLLLFIVVLAAFIVLAGKLLKSAARAKPQLPYEKAELLSNAERSFLGVLELALAGRYRIMAKVRVLDLIRVKAGLPADKRQSALNRIQSKHVDFVLCQPSDLSVAGAIELDDASHNRASRRQRDAFLDEALAAAGVPLYRFSAKRAYSVAELRAAFEQQAAPVEPALQR